MMKRRTIGAGIAAVVFGAATVSSAGAASADPADQPGPPPPVTTEGGVDMDAMMQTCVEQLPVDMRDQAWQMHEQMKQMMMPGGMPAPVPPAPIPPGMPGPTMPG
jgi:uncharacterized membrane protein